MRRGHAHSQPPLWTVVGTEWILLSFHNVNEAFMRENGYLGR
eukprot:COSAG01_NODE_19120_length_1029_cov_2.233333_1_plen_41_part_10